MKQTINLHQFREQFRLYERTNFSYEGLNVLFNALEEYEQDTGNEVELDVIGLCCEYVEMTAEEVKDNYEETEEWVNIEEFLTDHTYLCGWFMDGKDKKFVFQQF